MPHQKQIQQQTLCHETEYSFEIFQIEEQQSQRMLKSGTPIIIKSQQGFINPQLFTKNLKNQMTSNQLSIMLIVQLLSQTNNKEFQSTHKNLKINFKNHQINKIAFELSPNKIFDQYDQQKIKVNNKIIEMLEHINPREIVQKQFLQQESKKEQNQDKIELQNSEDHKDKLFDGYCLVIYPSHGKSFNLIKQKHPQDINSLCRFDILSYQKVKRICNQKYIFIFNGYQEFSNQKLESQVYYNWGDSTIEFNLIHDSGKIHFTRILKPLSYIFIPGGYKISFKANANQVGKLLSWFLLPRWDLLNIIKNYDNKQIQKNIPYAFVQTLIDFLFHQFSMIQCQNQEFMYFLANFINLEFEKEISILKNQLKQDQNSIQNGANDKKIDQCSRCKGFIINYFGIHKHNAYCVDCIKYVHQISKVLQKMSRMIFLEGCEILGKIYSYKNIKQQQYDCRKIWQNMVFYQYQDSCDGIYIGSHHNKHCKTTQSSKKIVYSKDIILKNSIQYLIKCNFIEKPIKILKFYSLKQFKNDAQKKYFKQIMIRASRFTKKQDQKSLLSTILPNYEQNDLKVLAIQLCAKLQL